MKKLTKLTAHSKACFITAGTLLAGLTLAAFALAISGCGSLPSKFETTFANVETNYVPRPIWQTNLVPVVIPVYQTNPVVVPVFVTNQLNQVVVTYSTNNVVNETWKTNIVAQPYVAGTNMVPVLHETPNANAQAAAGIIGSIAGLFVPGTQGVGSTIAAGLFAGYLGWRNRKWVAQATQATAGQQAMTQAAGALTQIIETGREVLSNTPQGAPLANAFTQWMITHQAATGTIQTIAGLVNNVTDNEEAQKAAATIQALISSPPVPSTAAAPTAPKA
jgi:hypothetical protein